jgi:hypothetical protein
MSRVEPRLEYYLADPEKQIKKSRESNEDEEISRILLAPTAIKARPVITLFRKETLQTQLLK